MVRIVLVGKVGVGKTSWCERNNMFHEKVQRTIGIEEYNIHLLIDRTPIDVDIMDSTGFQEHFDCVEFVCKTSDYIILFVDISQELIEEEIKEFINKIERIKRKEPTPSQIIVVGSKMDLKKIRLNKNDELEYMLKSQYPYIEMSSKTNENCFEVFYNIQYFAEKKKNDKKLIGDCSFL